MKLYIISLLVVLLGILGRVKPFPTHLEELDETIWPIPQQNGTFIWMTEEQAMLAALETEEGETTFEKLESVRFFLYTQKNPKEPFEIYLNDVESLKKSNFDSKNPTRFTIHGWGGSHQDLLEVREALLLNGEKNEFNIISVDWSVYAQTINYIYSKNRCSKAGEKVAELIDWLHDTANLSFDTLAIYGHSLGAHVSGFTGKHVKRGRVHTIVGLDPAMPLFRLKYPEKRLADTDAEYVETIHTNGGLMGFYNPIGQASFYPNGGRCQPGCENDIGGSCSHGKVVPYFAEALKLGHKNGFNAVGCADFESLKNGNCNQYSIRSRLGDPINARFANGIYYLKTNSESPYGIHIL